MKYPSSFSLAVVVAVALVASTAEALAPPPSRITASRAASHQAVHDKNKNNNEWWGPAATALAGLTLASQIATAAIVDIPSNVQHGRFFLLRADDGLTDWLV